VYDKKIMRDTETEIILRHTKPMHRSAVFECLIVMLWTTSTEADYSLPTGEIVLGGHYSCEELRCFAEPWPV